jgi:hypothetical protein
MLASVLHISLYDITKLHDLRYVLFKCTFRQYVYLSFPFSHMTDILPRDEDDFPFMSTDHFYLSNSLIK